MSWATTSQSSFNSSGAGATTPGLNLYLLFVISWFLHLPARLAFLGTIRFDLLLICILTGIALIKASNSGPRGQVEKVLRVLIVYAIVTIPFVYWPGSVLKSGLPNFIKAAVFFYFTVAFVRTELDLKKFLLIFISCQSFRILEPLYLNLTADYWGSVASMANWEYLARLSGAPKDVINPNGLAFVVCTVLPFFFFLRGLSWKTRWISLILVPLFLYVLALTGSRTGIIGLIVVMAGIVWKAKNPASFVSIAVAGLIALGVGFAFLDPDLQDRYLSIVGMGEKNRETLDDRWEGLAAQLDVVWNKPIVGYGLGTSAEANGNFTTTGPYAGWELRAHNLYLELALELGVFGLIIFLFLIKAIFSNFLQCRKTIAAHRNLGSFLPKVTDAMDVWLIMNLVFSFASYGLSSYEWYLFAGLSVVLLRLVKLRAASEMGEMRDGSLMRSRNNNG